MPAVRRIGLLGGSFNPAHDGHRHISLEALKRLRLDEVWWLVSPQNPLKPTRGMAPLDARIAMARKVAVDARIHVSALEKDLGTRYTADTIRALVERFPDVCFVWLMGADNLIQMPRWHCWTSIFYTVPIAVFARPTYSRRALSSRAARRFARARVRRTRAGALAGRRPPAWVFLQIPAHPESATRIRARSERRGQIRETSG